jgi:periplasmic mercuric ion binding protein
MKTILVTMLLLLGALTAPTVFAAEQTVEMNIEKMSCALCPITVRKAMENVDGVKEVRVDFDAKTATVTFDDASTSATEVAQASTDVGYPATPVEK